MKHSLSGRLLAIPLSVLLAAGTLAGCAGNASSAGVSSSQSQSAQAQESESSQEAKTSTPLIAAANNTGVGHLDSMLAYTGGFYEKEGLDVEMYYNPNNAECTQALIEGKVGLTSGASTCVLNYIDQGEDLVIIGGQMTEGASLFSLPERANEFPEISEETLKGKKIGVTRLQSGDIAFRSWLHEQGIDLSQIEFVELDSCATIIEALKKKEIDLGSLFLTYRQTAEAQGLTVVKHLDELYPDFICCRIYTTRENLEKDRDTYVRAIKANIEAYNLISTDEETTIQNSMANFDIDEDVIREQIYEYGHLSLNPSPSKKDIEKFYASMVDIGYANGGINIDDYIDVSVYEDALDQLIAEYPDNQLYQQLKAESEETNH